MRRHLSWFTLPALALAFVLCLPDESFAQRRGGGGGRGGGWGGGGRGYAGWGRGYGGWGRGYYGGGWGYGGLGVLGLGYGGWGGYPGYGYGGWGYGGSYYSPYYTTPSYYSTPIYPDAYAAAPGGTYDSFYPSAATTQQPVDNSRAMVRVRVPGNAQVLINDTPTQTGPDRTFVSPPLDPNQSYSYTVTAQWMENGQQRRDSRTVRVVPGQTAEVNFMTAQNDSSRVR